MKNSILSGIAYAVGAIFGTKVKETKLKEECIVTIDMMEDELTALNVGGRATEACFTCKSMGKCARFLTSEQFGKSIDFYSLEHPIMGMSYKERDLIRDIIKRYQELNENRGCFGEFDCDIDDYQVCYHSQACRHIYAENDNPE